MLVVYWGGGLNRERREEGAIIKAVATVHNVGDCMLCTSGSFPPAGWESLSSRVSLVEGCLCQPVPWDSEKHQTESKHPFPKLGSRAEWVWMGP